MIYKLGIVEEEADECGYWLDMLVDAEEVPAASTVDLQREADEILRIMVASLKTLKTKRPLTVREHRNDYSAADEDMELELGEAPNSKIQIPN